MNSIIKDDFAQFVELEDLFNSDVKLYNSQGGTLVYEGRGIYDRKPQAVQNEQGEISYQGHKSILSIPNYMTAYSDIKGYYVEITDNKGTLNYLVELSAYSSNVDKIYCELKLA